MNPWPLKTRIVVYILSIVACVLLFYFALFFAKENEREESRIIEATIRFHKQIIIKDGFFEYNENVYGVYQMTPPEIGSLERNSPK
ncbi:hypothetical protein LCGC14_0579740 [marine sediment metagenome]|uniref:Uncharacterized protein n=1 Tax=marine sediment metagenome TaxID=412755 RepID=A0A0F9S0A9_9ZZZZ